MSITKEALAAVKGRGFLRNRGTDCFSGRIVSAGGAYTAEDLKHIAQCAEQFGNGSVIFTSRQSAEVVGIPFEKIESAEAFAAAHGLIFGGTGAKVRPVTACKGTTCVFGNIDVSALARALHERFFIGMRDVKLPHKYKIGVGGCPNSCVKPSLNDIGIEGRRPYAFDADLCRGCKNCAVTANCAVKAASTQDGKTVVDPTKCLSCGVCVGKCPFGAVPKEVKGLCRIYVGGTWGKNTRMGTPLNRLYEADEVPEIVEKVLLWYRENGYVKERLALTLDRVGVDHLEKALASDDLMNRRAEILAAPLKERP